MNHNEAKTEKNANGSTPVPTSTAHDNTQINVGAIIPTHRPQSYSVFGGGVAGCCASVSTSSSAGIELKWCWGGVGACCIEGFVDAFYGGLDFLFVELRDAGIDGPDSGEGIIYFAHALEFRSYHFDVIVLFASRKTGDGDGCGHVNEVIRLSK
jgi:hypothetical protein